MKNLFMIVVAILTLSSSLFATDHKHGKRKRKAHHHGSGKMNLAIEKNNMVIEMEIPAHDIIGFEHEAKTKKQKKKLKSAISTLKNSDSILMIASSVGCQISKPANIKVDLEEEHDHGHSHESDHKKEEEKHAEFHITYAFKCNKMATIKQIEVLAFKEFSKMKKIKAQAVTPKGQFSQELTPTSTTLKLGK